MLACCAGTGTPPGSSIDANVDAGMADGDTSGALEADAADTPDADTADTPDADTGTPDGDAAACSPCRLVDQCGCNPATEACDLGGSYPSQGTTACRPVLIDGTGLDTCNDWTSCAAGYVCLGASGQASCKRYCSSDAECEGGGGLCVIEVTSGGTPIPGVKVCSPSCDPFTSSGCPSGWACGAFSDSVEQRNFTWCAVPGQGVNNAICSDDGQCAAGFTCVSVSGTHRCKKYCDKGDGSPGCAANQTCVGLVDAAGHPLLVAGVSYGVCN